MGKQLYPSLNAAEADASASTHARVDFLSNGFKIREVLTHQLIRMEKQ